jgi:hypothetical protein
MIGRYANTVMSYKGYSASRRFGYAGDGSSQGNISRRVVRWSKQRGNQYVLPPKNSVTQPLERCYLLVRGAFHRFVTCWHYHFCGWMHIVQTGLDCRTKIVPVLHLAAQTYASAERMSADARRHPCISHTLVRFVPSQWTASETDMIGPHRGAIESRRIGRACGLNELDERRGST